MGKTFRRDKSFRPKAHGRTYNKDFQPWKKPKKPNSPQSNDIRPEYIDPPPEQ